MKSLYNKIFRAALMALAVSTIAPATAAADTQLITNCPQPTATGGVILGDSVTECPAGGSYELNATPNAADFPQPWGEPYLEPGLIIGGGPGPEPHGGPR